MPSLYHSDSKLSVSTSIELAKDGGHVSYELDHDNETVTFSFGIYQDLMLELTIESLRRMLELGAAAVAEISRFQQADEAQEGADWG